MASPDDLDAAIGAGDPDTAARLARGLGADADEAIRRAAHVRAFGSPDAPATVESLVAHQTRLTTAAMQQLLEEYAGTASIANPVRWLREHGGQPDRRDMPWIASSVITFDIVHPDAAAKLIGDAWTTCENPSQALTLPEWRELFAAVEFIDTSTAPWPSGEFIVYRGAIEECRDGLSWTPSLERATWYAHRFGSDCSGKTGRVWQTHIYRDDVLARFDGASEGSDEYVVDTEGLDITPHEHGTDT